MERSAFIPVGLASILLMVGVVLSTSKRSLSRSVCNASLRRIGRRIACDNFQIVGAIGHGSGIPGIKLLVEIVFEQQPVALVFSAEVDGVLQIVVVVVVGRPQHGLIALLLRAWGCMFEFWRGIAGVRYDARRVGIGRRRLLQRHIAQGPKCPRELARARPDPAWRFHR